jgi:uncharacterized membrane protein
MNNANQQNITATFDTHQEAESAVKRLSEAGFEMKDLTVLGLDYHTEERPIGFVNTGTRMVAFGKYGAFWGGLWGLMFGSALLFIPGVGHVILAGWLASSLVGAAEGVVAGGALGALGAALFTAGIPKDSIVKYETDIKAGKFLVIARGDNYGMEMARDIFGNHVEKTLATV